MRVLIKSVEDAFEYVLDHYTPVGAEEYALRSDKYAIISIQDTNTKGFGFEFKENKFCKGVLTLYFDDIERKVKNATLFNKEMANQIIDFIDTYKNKVDTLVIHCYAGQSRSRAVGAFALHMLHKDNSELIEYGSPNLLIYNLLMKEYKKKCRVLCTIT